MDNYTLKEVNELFLTWNEHPPVYVLLKALVEGLGGGTKPKPIDEAQIQELTFKSRGALPVVAKGKNPFEPKAAPVFDLETMRAKNREILLKKRA